MVKRLERKIDERLRSSTSRIAVNGLGFNEMHLLASFAESVVQPTIEGFFAVEGGLTIAPNSLKRWWPGTELNRRRQPFQGCALPPELPGHIYAHDFAGFVRVGRAGISAELNDRRE